MLPVPVQHHFESRADDASAGDPESERFPPVRAVAPQFVMPRAAIFHTLASRSPRMP